MPAPAHETASSPRCGCIRLLWFLWLTSRPSRFVPTDSSLRMVINLWPAAALRLIDTKPIKRPDLRIPHATYAAFLGVSETKHTPYARTESRPACAARRGSTKAGPLVRLRALARRRADRKLAGRLHHRTCCSQSARVLTPNRSSPQEIQRRHTSTGQKHCQNQARHRPRQSATRLQPSRHCQQNCKTVITAAWQPPTPRPHPSPSRPPPAEKKEGTQRRHRGPLRPARPEDARRRHARHLHKPSDRQTTSASCSRVCVRRQAQGDHGPRSEHAPLANCYGWTQSRDFVIVVVGCGPSEDCR